MKKKEIFKSKLEEKVASKLKQLDYEPKKSKLKYITPHTYSPDFVHEKTPYLLVEVKGIFRSSREATKYLHIREQNRDYELVFVISNPEARAYPSCKLRSDGTRLSMRDWLSSNQFLFYSVDNIPNKIAKGIATREWIKQERRKRGYDK